MTDTVLKHAYFSPSLPNDKNSLTTENNDRNRDEVGGNDRDNVNNDNNSNNNDIQEDSNRGSNAFGQEEEEGASVEEVIEEIEEWGG